MLHNCFVFIKNRLILQQCQGSQTDGKKSEVVLDKVPAVRKKIVDLLEDLALVELAAVLVLALPIEILVDHGLGLLGVGVELLPVVGGVVDLPVVAELEGQVVASPDPDAGDGGVVVLAEEAH